MICPRCKKVYSKHMKYCISCGTELVESDENVISVEREIVQSGGFDGIFDDIPPMPANADYGNAGGFVREISMSAAEDKHSLPQSCMEKKGRVFIVLLKNTAAVLMSVVLMTAVIAASMSAAGRALTEERNIAKGVEGMDLLSLPISGFLQTEGYDIPEDATIEEAITVMTAGSGVNSGNIRTIYENSDVESFITAIAADYGEYIRSGKVPDKITAEMVKDLFSENLSVINKSTGYILVEEDIQLAYSEIERSAELFDSIYLIDMQSESVRLFRAFISTPMLAAFAAAGIGAAAVIAALLKNGTRTAKYIAVPLIAGGLVILAVTFMFSMQIGFFGTADVVTSEVMKGMSAAVSDILYKAGGGAVFIGALLIIWSATVKRVKAV